MLDDDGHATERGKRHAVCEKTFNLCKHGPYADVFEFIEPRVAVEGTPAPFLCQGSQLRHPRGTKGQDYHATTEAAGSCCSPGGDGASCC